MSRNNYFLYLTKLRVVGGAGIGFKNGRFILIKKVWNTRSFEPKIARRNRIIELLSKKIKKQGTLRGLSGGGICALRFHNQNYWMGVVVKGDFSRRAENCCYDCLIMMPL
jgi:hypothetical protein